LTFPRGVRRRLYPSSKWYPVTTLIVEGMTCGHCKRAVTEAIRSVDPTARVDVDLASGTVTTDSSAALDLLANAIRSEGYYAAPDASHA